MGDRLELQAVFEDILGSSAVYMQPPTNVSLVYPCIIYSRNNWHTRYAGNGLYKDKIAYQVTVVDRNPDSEIPHQIARLPYASYERFFAKDQLNHDVFTVFY